MHNTCVYIYIYIHIHCIALHSVIVMSSGSSSSITTSPTGRQPSTWLPGACLS